MPDLEKLIWDNDVEAFASQPKLGRNLGNALFQALASHSSREILVDRTQGRKVLKAGVLLALALQLAAKIKREETGDRVGIVLPPGAGAMIANIAVLLANKSPVNLNFTLGRSAIVSCLRNAGIKTLITADAMRKKCSDFPWPDHCIDISEALQAIPRRKIIALVVALRLCPSSLLARFFGVSREGGDCEAALLFTSGSSGDPKGVVLTHRNILGNIEQIARKKVLWKEDAILAAMPVFHSFGFTVTICFALMKGLRIVTLPSPLEVGKIITAIEEEKVTIHIGTPTFFRPYLRKATRERLASLRAVIAGAEKTPAGFHGKWESALGVTYLEGYGLTETTPVVSCNLPDPEERREGSVGRLFPGMAARILNPDTERVQSVFKPGILCLKGVNVFPGYLNNSEDTNKAIDREGWFISGDLARLDEEGFLYIEGRLSRFSKIGGEMVPHGTVEQAIIRALGLEESDTPMLAITSREDSKKGEALVLICALDVDMNEMRAQLAASSTSLPNLWIPRECIRVESIPLLASGKLDIKGLKAITERLESSQISP